MPSKIRNIAKSQKGDAIILLAVLVTGIIMLVTAVVVESLRRSGELQSLQKQSVDNLYKAEEGVEFGLYANKEKTFTEKENPPFSIKVYENSSSDGTDSLGAAYEKLKLPAQNRSLVITSQNASNGNDGTLKRTVFANVPSKYYDQVELWDSRNNCGANCDVSNACAVDGEADDGHLYQIILNASDFQRGDCGEDPDSAWCVDNTRYRVALNCGGDSCTVRDLQVGIDCDSSQCGASNCSPLLDMDLWGGNSQMSGKVILSDWFKFFDTEGNTVDLRNKSVMVQFYLVSGSLEQIGGLNGEDIKMCKQKIDGTWTSSTGNTCGMATLEFRKENQNIHYHCCGYEQVCTDVCDSGHNDCCSGHSYTCQGNPGYSGNYSSWDHLCNSGNVGSCCFGILDPCTNVYTCMASCADSCVGGICYYCDSSHQECHNGNCDHYCQD